MTNEWAMLHTCSVRCGEGAECLLRNKSFKAAVTFMEIAVNFERMAVSKLPRKNVKTNEILTRRLGELEQRLALFKKEAKDAKKRGRKS